MRSILARLRVFAVVATLVVVAAACGDTGGSAGESSGATGGSGGPSTTAAPQRGGSLTFLMPSETKSMDPLLGGGSALSGEPPRLFAVYDALIYTENATNTVVMGTAESISSSDNVVWTLKIRPNIKFSDGTAYDAAAVKTEWERRRDPAKASPSIQLMTTIKALEVVDPLTLRITLATENPVFPRNVSATLAYIPSPAAVTAKGADFGGSPVGAGPFMLKDWTRDSQMTLVRNPTYWKGPDSPYLDQVVIRIIADEQQRINSLANGEADAAYINVVTNQKQAKDMGLNVFSIPGIGSTGIAYNMTKPPFDDVRVRKAIQTGIDPVQFNQAIYTGLGEVPTAWFPSDYVFVDPSVALPKFDATEAQKLFDAYATEKGKDVELEFKVNDSGVNPKIAEFIAATLQKYNHVKVKTILQPQAQGTTDIRAKNFGAISYAYLGVDPEPNFTETFLTGGARNFWNYSNATVDAALKKARGSSDNQARKAAYVDVQRQLNQDLPMYIFPRTRTAIVTVKGNKVQNATLLHDDGGPRFAEMWIKK